MSELQEKRPRQGLWLRGGLALLCSLSAVGWAAGCGGDGKGDSANDSTKGPNDNIELGVGGDGFGSGSAEPSDGGRVDLTPEEIAAINGASCTGWSGEGENVPAVLQLVVDVSGSMDDPASDSGMGGPSKWDVTSDALKEALDSLPPSVSVGVLFYPNMSTDRGQQPADVSNCVAVDDMIPIAPLGNPGSPQRTTIDDGIDSADVGSYTPTYDAYTYALETSLIPYETSARKFMLLITDGAPTVAAGCVSTGSSGGPNGGPNDAPTQPIINQVESANSDDGVRTFLIGSPGSQLSSSNMDMRPWLSEAASVGGTAAEMCMVDGPSFCHLDMTEEPDFGAALSQGLAAIAGQIIDDCTFNVPDAPDGETIDPDRTNLIIRWGDGTASLILPDEVGDCTDGWMFNSEGQVVLCEATCNEVKLDSQAAVDLSFGCSTEEIVNPIR